MSQKDWSGNGPHQFTQDNSPFYTYRDQTLFHPANGTNYVDAGKKQQFLLLRFLIKVAFLFFVIGSPMILPLHYLAVYSTYRQGGCTITNKQVREQDSKDKQGKITSRTYYPSFSYLVHPLSGGQASATGYDGPNQVSYTTSRDAQAVVDRYQIGETTSCSYNPAKSYKAFLVFYGYGTVDARGTFFWNLPPLGGLAITIYLIFDWAVWRPYALWKRGVVTKGTVVRYEERLNSRLTRRRPVSILAFRTLEEPTKEREIAIDNLEKHNLDKQNVTSDFGDRGYQSLLGPYSSLIPIGTHIPVCYDPFYPRYHRCGEWPSSWSYMPGLVVIAVLLLIAFFMMLGLWLVP